MMKSAFQVLGRALIGLALALGASAAASGGVTTQITENSIHDWGPAVSGSNVVWSAPDGSNHQIYLWDGTTTTQITDNSVDDAVSGISGSNVVWWGSYDASDYEIYLVRGAPTSPPQPVPSVSFGGLAVLAGLVLAIVAWAKTGPSLTN